MKKFDIFLHDRSTAGVIFISAIPQTVKRYRNLSEADQAGLTELEGYLLSGLDYVVTEE